MLVKDSHDHTQEGVCLEGDSDDPREDPVDLEDHPHPRVYPRIHPPDREEVGGDSHVVDRTWRFLVHLSPAGRRGESSSYSPQIPHHPLVVVPVVVHRVVRRHNDWSDEEMDQVLLVNRRRKGVVVVVVGVVRVVSDVQEVVVVHSHEEGGYDRMVWWIGRFDIPGEGIEEVDHH